MLRQLCIIWTIFICFSPSSRAADKVTSAPQISNVLSYVTTVQNMAKFDFATTEQKINATWIVATIMPGRFSGGGVARSSYFDVDTGKIVKNPNGHDVIRVNGTFHIETFLTGKSEKVDYTYLWEFPFSWMPPRNSPDPVRPFKIFIDGGTAVFPITNDFKDSKDVLPVYPIPTEWQEFVVPAWKYYRENSALFQPEDAVKNQVKLRQLLEDDNPFIAIGACRVLANAHLLDKTSIDTALKNAPQLQQAVFTLLLLTPQPVKAKEDQSVQDSVDVVTQFIATSNTPSNLRGIAIGALTGLRELDNSGSVRAFQILDALDKKHEALHTDADGIVGSVLRMAALPLLRHNPLYQEPVPQR